VSTELLPAGVRAIAFDLDGTLYEGDDALPGARETVRALRARGVALRFLTNTTSKCRASIAEKLVRLGFEVEPDQILSPPFVAGEFLRSSNASASLFVQEAALPDFLGVRRDAQRPDWVVVGDLAQQWTFETLNHAFRLVQVGGAGLIGLGRTRYWQTTAGLQLDAGPFVAALEYATGRKARVFGKPEPDFFHAVAGSLGCEPAAVAVVGDDVRTDVGAAIEAGLAGVLVRTGKFRPADLDSGIEPDAVLSSVADLLTGHVDS